MPIDIPAPLTRKLGPLPAWGWGVAIGGAILVAKVLRKPSGASGSSPAPTSIGGGIGGTGTVVGTGPDATTQPGDPFSGPNSLITQLQDTINGQGNQIAGLSGTIGTLSGFQALQTKLSGLLDQRQLLFHTIENIQDAQNTARDSQRACTTDACRSKYAAQLTAYSKQHDTAVAQQASLTTQIIGIQKQLNGSTGT